MVVLAEPVLEHQTALYSFTLVDEDGLGVDVSTLASMKLTYYDVATKVILNTRQAQNALNANNVTVTTIPLPTVTTVLWVLQPADTVLQDSRREREQHIALFEWTWQGGAKSAAHEVQFAVEQITYVV